MTGLSDIEVLTLYEAGQQANGIERLALLHHAATGNPDIRVLPLGRIDFAIWRLRSETIAEPALAVTECQSCAERIEFELPRDALLHDESAQNDVQISFQGKEFKVRMPCINDFASGTLDPKELCAEAPWNDEQFRSIAEEVLQEADPALGSSINCVCANCQQSTILPFDPSAFFWIELEQRVKRLISDIVTLAKRLGWSERDILAMGPTRRNWYLQEIAQ